MDEKPEQLEIPAGNRKMTTTREEFEAWAKDCGHYLKRRADGVYTDSSACKAWDAWQAAHLAGQRAMQERAAEACDEHAIQTSIWKAAVNEDGGPAFRHCCLDTASGAMDSAAEEIRNLEVTTS